MSFGGLTRAYGTQPGREPRLRVIVVTNLWPSPRRPGWGSFVASRVAALRRLGHDVEVVAVGGHASAPRRYASLLARITAVALRRSIGRAGAGPATPGESRRRRGTLSTSLSTVVEAHIAYPTGLLAWPLAARLRVPLVLFAHGSDVVRLPSRSRFDRVLCRLVFGRAGLVVANSDYLAGEIVKRLDVPMERIAVVSPGIRYADLAAARDAAPPDRPHPLLVVAHLVHLKGVDVLIAALAELGRRGREVPRLRVVGDGPERAQLSQLSAVSGVDVDFAGELAHNTVVEELAAADILVVPSRREALGLAPLEAMAAGCVPLVTAVGGLLESVVDGVTGLTCVPDDPAALASALERALAIVHDPARRAAMAAAADAVACRHDVDVLTAHTVAIYADLARGAQTSAPMRADKT